MPPARRAVPLAVAAAVGLLLAVYRTQLAQGVLVLGGPSAAGRLLSPSKLAWLLTLAAGAAVAYPLAAGWWRWYAQPRWAVAGRGRWLLAGAAAGWGGLVLVWWDYGLHDDIWLFGPPVRPALEAGRVAAAWLLATALAGSVLGLAVPTTSDWLGRSRDRKGASSPEEEDAPLRSRLLPSQSAGWFRWRWAAVGWAAVVGVLVGFAGWFVGQERAIYYWDFAGYWVMANELGKTLAADPAVAARQVAESVKSGDYNLLPALPPAAVAAVTGPNRLAHVLAVFATCGLAVAVAVSAAVRTVGRGWPGGPSAAASVAPAVALVGPPLLWAAALRGMVDVGGVALALGVLAVYLSRPAGRLGWRRTLAVAGLLLALSLYRRWYNFWVVAFLLGFGLETAVVAASALRRDGWRTAAGRCRPLIAVGAVFLAGWLSLAWPLLARVAATDYATAYIGYKSEYSFAVRLAEVPQMVGFLPAALAGAGAVVLLADRRTRRAGLLTAGMVPVTAVHFHRTQDAGLHHYGLFMPGLVLLTAAGLTRAVLAVPPGPARGGLLTLAAVVGGAVSVATFVPSLNATRRAAEPLTPRMYVHPLVRDDLPELRRLLAVLDARVPAGQRFAVVSSSLGFNQTTLMLAADSLGERFPAVDRLMFYPEVDRVNGFPTPALAADYLVVADPPQTHLRPGQQLNVTAVAAAVLGGTGVGAGFERLPEAFALDDGVTVRLFRRARPATAAEVAALAAVLEAAHPGFPAAYTPPGP